MLSLCCHPLKKLRVGIWTPIYHTLEIGECLLSLGSPKQVAYGLKWWVLFFKLI